MAEEEAIEKIRSFILERSGLYFEEHDMPSLKDNIDKRTAALHCPSYSDYYDILAQSPQARREFASLMNLLTIKHSHFFRDPKQFIGLRDKVLPKLIEEKAKTGNFTLNILSAGCATGEEPYSIAMVVLDFLGKRSLRKVKILATDISTEALIFAKKGNYPERALRYIEEALVKEYMEKFCTIHKGNIFISPIVRDIVDFQYMNLVDEFYPRGLDIIFCRNVTIYFDIETAKNVIEKFYQSLSEKGYLFTGATETLYGISDKFKLMEIDQALVYEKIPTERPGSKEVWPWQPVAKKTKETDTSLAMLPTKSLKEAYRLYEKAKDEFIRKEYEVAIKLAQSALGIEPALQEAYILLANIFVNQDKFEEAERECKKALDKNFLSAEPHYLLGLIYKKKGQYEKALDSFKKAIYLNANYSLAHFSIADLYRERGEAEEALKGYRNTLRALEQETEEHFKESSGGFAKKALTQACVRNIQELS